MNARIKRKLNMFKRIVRFLADNIIAPPIARATAALAVVVATIAALEAAAEKQANGKGQAGGGVDARKFHAKQLREKLKLVNTTAREMEEDRPGISDKFRLSGTGSYVALKAVAESIISEATPLAAEFVDHGLPADFLTDLEDLLTAFEEATSEKDGGVNKRKVGTTTLVVKVKKGLAAAKILNACVRNHFVDQPEIVEAWAAARRIESAPRSNATAATAAPAPAPTAPATA